MVIGPRTKSRKSPSVHLDYIIHIQEIKPWPPSQSLRTLRAVLIQWDHGDRASGSTNQVVPSLGTGSGVGDGRIEFNESIRLSVMLMRDLSLKSGDGDTFQKNCIEFNLYEPRRGKAVKGQLLGSAVLDLADHGIVKENRSVSIPVNCQRSYRNTVQPLLFLNFQSVDRRRSNSSSIDSLMREPSMDRSRAESVSTLVSEEYAEEEEAEVASSSVTDDDISSHSSAAVASLATESNGSSSPPQNNKENGIVNANGSAEEGTLNLARAQSVAKSCEEQDNETHENSTKNSSSSSSMDLSSDLAWISKKIGARGQQSSAVEQKEKKSSFHSTSIEPYKESVIIREDSVNSDGDAKVQVNPHVDESSVSAAKIKPRESNGRANTELASVIKYQQDDEDASPPDSDSLLVSERDSHPQVDCSNDKQRAKQETHCGEVVIVETKEQETESGLNSLSSQNDAQQLVPSGNDTLSSSRENSNSISSVDRSKLGRSVRSLSDSSRNNGSIRSNHFIVSDAQNKGQVSLSSERRDSKMSMKETRNQVLESKIHQLEHRVKVLEGELIEAASIEISLYSVITEHGSSATKVHAPARRLSRLYFHASKQNLKSRRASAANSIVSGLVLVAKACGNDVPRLSFWLSNVIVLRVIISKSFVDNKLLINLESAPTGTTSPGDKKANKKTLPLKWESSPTKADTSNDTFCEWENPKTFAHALEKVEKWIFSRIIESLWWQTFTPHMQSGAAKEIEKSINSESSKLSRSNSIEQQQGNYSVELWERAFRDASERICPLRAEGHDCGCMPVLSRLIMEQLIARLDVAMFNAILRESADEIPTDPVADPISDPNVLPIPPGKASFGAGAQLKNAIGNWCRWLTDLFGIDDDDPLENKNSMEHDDYFDDEDDDERRSHDASSKCFRLLNALSDLMMLPKDMLLSRTIRKEVCPTFGSPLIRRVLNSFIPDEFCPDPIPRVVLEALNSEDPHDEDSDVVADTTMNSFPCAAPPILYQTPSAASIASVIALGEIDGCGGDSLMRRSGSSSSSYVLKKSQTSDDELDELDSPLNSIVLEGFESFKSSRCVDAAATRYRLLREAWNRIG